tara:strand:- start:530 stop:1006 length:477 start_codon:yes stop_codon:yes gene_type:complete
MKKSQYMKMMELMEGFGGQLDKKDLDQFEKARKENAEVLGYTLAGTSEYDEIINNQVKEQLHEGVAETIMKQIGRHTLGYVGAKNFAKGRAPEGEYLQFNVRGSKLKQGGKLQVIYRRGSDTYTIKAWVIRGSSAKLKDEVEGLYGDMIPAAIKKLVG